MNEEGLKYSEEHLWVRVEGGQARFGITDHAQQELEDIIYVELPEKGRKVEKGEIVCTIESVKSTNDLPCPLSGEIHSVNNQLREQPETISKDPYGAGWIFTLEMAEPSEADELLDLPGYRKIIES